MRFESVTAHAFGPFTDQRLEFAPGLNVVYGPNEAGKSSWHAALYAGLCGLRRARGQPRADERAFTERHRPWDGQTWRVSAVIRLEDGRRIELWHDLEGKVDCRAVDADLGRDCSAEIIHEGAPDGARWLGLDRRSFLATACVRQAELLAIRDHADLLQTSLQRAAASATAESTAAAALERIERFRSDRIGSERAPTRPLRQALERVAAAREALTAARRGHEEFIDLAVRERALGQEAADAAHQLRLAQAARAAREAERWRTRLRRVRELAAELAAAPPADATAHQEHARPAAGPAVRLPWAAALAASVLAVTGTALALAGVLLPGLALLLGAAGWLLWQVRGALAAARQQLRQAEAAVQAHHTALRRRAELEQLLEGLTVEQLEAETRRRQEQAAQLAAGLDAGEIAAFPLEPNAEAQLARLAEQARAAAARHAQACGELEARRAVRPDVAAAEEALAAAEAELARLRQLGWILDRARQFLEQAQQQVHRDIAPQLASSIRRWLLCVTNQRYDDVRVDPETLDVLVRGSSGRWRRAALLSHGTAEQVYLLLRVAMAERLTRPGEVCPLILDDVTVQCDAERKRAVLETLRTISRERQVILFTQELEVLDWASAAADPARDRILRLDPPTLAA